MKLAFIVGWHHAQHALLDANARLAQTVEELKRDERRLIQSERLSALGQLAGRIMHEFNNALVPVLGYTELLLENPRLLTDQVETHKILQQIRTSVLQAVEAVRKLREFYQPAEREPRALVDLNAVLQAALASPAAHKTAAAVNLNTHWGELLPVRGDPDELQEAFAHVLANAYEAMPDGGSLTVVTRPTDRGVEIEIRDTGIGMDEATLQRCFEPFFSTKGRGVAGIGLAMVHGILRTHGGDVDLHSHIGKGTVVTLRLPSSADVRSVYSHGEWRPDSGRAVDAN